MAVMPNVVREKLLKISKPLGWEVQRRPDGKDLYEKLISLTHHGYPSRVCIDKHAGVSKSGTVKYFKVIVHPAHYRADLENASKGVRAAINRQTKENRHSHSGFQGFPIYDGNDEPCGKGYIVDSEAGLRWLLEQLSSGIAATRRAEPSHKEIEVEPDTHFRSGINHQTIEKGLVIDMPWIDKILRGEKTWEMRSRHASHRGWFGLIRKGSGLVVGVARLVDSLGPLAPDKLQAATDQHAIGSELRPELWMGKWNIAWVLADVRKLAQPVPYIHQSGAVTWVRLDKAAREAIGKQVDACKQD